MSKIDFETEISRWRGVTLEELKNSMTPILHAEYNMAELRARIGEARMDELWTAMMLGYGYPGRWTGHFKPDGTLGTFRDALVTITGIRFSLTESIVWFGEYKSWIKRHTATGQSS